MKWSCCCGIKQEVHHLICLIFAAVRGYRKGPPVVVWPCQILQPPRCASQCCQDSVNSGMWTGSATCTTSPAQGFYRTTINFYVTVVQCRQWPLAHLAVFFYFSVTECFILWHMFKSFCSIIRYMLPLLQAERPFILWASSSSFSCDCSWPQNSVNHSVKWKHIVLFAVHSRVPAGSGWGGLWAVGCRRGSRLHIWRLCRGSY